MLFLNEVEIFKSIFLFFNFPIQKLMNEPDVLLAAFGISLIIHTD